MLFDASRPVDVAAPEHALGWSPSRGFITDPEELLEARGEGELLLDVTDAEPPTRGLVVEAVEGDTPLSVTVRQDRQLAELDRYVRDLHMRMVAVTEAANEILLARREEL